jgi:uncharacterized membrane protein YdfJ with MMPL/SSD domain
LARASWGGTTVGGALAAVGSFCARRKFTVLAAWAILIVVMLGLIGAFGAQVNNNFSLPGTGSQSATDLLESDFPPQQNGTSPIVFHIDSGSMNDDANKAAVKASLQNILAVPNVYSATNPYAQPQAGLISSDEKTALIPVLMEISSGSLTVENSEPVLAATQPAIEAGMETAAGGPIGSALSEPDTGPSEAIGMIAAAIILAFVFGTLIAIGLPLVTAIFGLAVGIAAVGLLGHIVAIPSTGTTLATMIGLGVGIDYSLFLISRHLENLRNGLSVHESVRSTVATSGNAVVFAGTTVIIALLALGVAQIPLVTALGYATAVAVATAVLAAITLLPAILGLSGMKIMALRIPGLGKGMSKDPANTIWGKWSRLITGRAVFAVVLALLVSAPLIYPMFSMKLGQEDLAVTPESTTQRQAFDIVNDEYGPGYNGPLLAATELNPVAAPSAQYTAQYDQATALQSQLEAEQTSLTNQADELEAEEANLEAQAATLTSDKADLQAEEKSLTKQKNRLENQKSALEREEQSLKAQTKQLKAEQKATKQARADLRAQAKPLVAELENLGRADALLSEDIFILDARIAVETDPIEKAKLELKRAAKSAERAANRIRIAVVEKKLVDLADPARVLAKQERQIAAHAKVLAREAVVLVRQAAALARQAAQLAAQAAALAKEAKALEAKAADLTKQGNQLQAAADSLQKQKKAAEQQKQVAEQLQQELTAELTLAGGDPRGTDTRIVTLQNALTATPGVALVSPPSINSSGSAYTLSAIPTTQPADPATATLVQTVRDDVVPPTEVTGVVTYVGGSTAANVDLATQITDKLPYVIGVVLILSFVLMLVVFRSLLVPLQAVITNLVCVGISFGVLTAVFQWGWGLSLIDLPSPTNSVPIISYVPLMMFAALFGLSMDYQVFAISHIQSEKLAGASAHEAVRKGLAGSGRVIAAAALIMMSVFGSFILNPNPVIKEFGVGLTVAVFFAGLMTLWLTPALLTLFGEATWHLPRFLDRILPHISIEGSPDERAELDAEIARAHASAADPGAGSAAKSGGNQPQSEQPPDDESGLSILDK